MTSPFNERLRLALETLAAEAFIFGNYGLGKGVSIPLPDNDHELPPVDKAEAALLSLFREMVEEAKPEPKDQVGQIPFDDESRCRFYRYGGYNFAIDQYEANLLQQLGERG